MTGFRKEVATGILIVMSIGLISNALAMWRNQAVLQNKVKVVEYKQKTQDNVNKDIADKMDGIYWYLIESKGIKVPSKGKR